MRCVEERLVGNSQVTDRSSRLCRLAVAKGMNLMNSGFLTGVAALGSECVGKWAGRFDARRLGMLALAVTALTVVSDPAHAQTGGGQGDITTFLTNIVNLITGPAGKSVAVLGICVAGIGALLGALSLRVVGGVILGIMMLFSASWIVTQIVGQ